MFTCKINELLRPTKTKRLIFFLLSDTIIFIASFYLAFLLRFDFFIPYNYYDLFYYWLPVFIILKIVLLWCYETYKVNWSYIGIHDFLRIFYALSLFVVPIFSINFILQLVLNKASLPKSIILIDYFISLFLVCALRISKRVYLEILGDKSVGKRTLIIGAGETGERIARELNRKDGYRPICFVDDADIKIGTLIHNVPVLGKLDDIEEVIKDNKIETVIIAIPTLNHKKIKEIFEKVKKVGVKDIKIIPSISKMPSSSISVKDLREISIEDLIFRETVKIEEDKIKDFIKGKTILVSGAGGSIGSEIVRQLIKFSPKRIVGLEIDETEIYNLYLELQNIEKSEGVEICPVVGDVRNRKKISGIFKKYLPEIVFHAAAYKHVPLMEYFPEEVANTNIFGTYNMAMSAIENNVVKFINISTDKAVNPTSMMGATKRMAEMICNALNQVGKTKFISVRFGNVLGSRGSVIPIFLEQIKRGGPVTVTHPEMKRYFMTIPEAVLLVFQAALMGKDNEVFVLDMGEPIKIVRLAEEFIRTQGLEPYKDIDIVFTGLRPGEKLFEELLTAEEGTRKTYHKQIFIANISKYLDHQKIPEILEELNNLIEHNPNGIKPYLKRFVPFNNGIDEQQQVIQHSSKT